MDLQKFEFPKLNGVDIAFSTQKTNPALLAEAKERGFYNGSGPFNSLFSKLFFSGGKLDFKDGLPVDFKNSATAYFKAFAASFEPKHEEKDAICAMLLSELVKEPNMEGLRGK